MNAFLYPQSNDIAVVCCMQGSPDLDGEDDPAMLAAKEMLDKMDEEERAADESWIIGK